MRLELLVLAAVAVSGGCAHQEPVERRVEVTEVIDGDSLKVRLDGEVKEVRLLGVDAPEMTSVNPREYDFDDSEQVRDCLRLEANRSFRYLSRLEGEEVILRQDGVQDRRGDYGRLLGYIHRNETSRSENLLMLEKGHARLYASEFAMFEEFRQAQRDSRQKGAGLWRCATRR